MISMGLEATSKFAGMTPDQMRDDAAFYRRLASHHPAGQYRDLLNKWAAEFDAEADWDENGI